MVYCMLERVNPRSQASQKCGAVLLLRTGSAEDVGFFLRVFHRQERGGGGIVIVMNNTKKAFPSISRVRAYMRTWGLISISQRMAGVFLLSK